MLGFGFGYGIMSNEANVTFTQDAESVYELYYNAQIIPGFNVTPSMQYVINPGAVDSVPNATVLAVRFHLAI